METKASYIGLLTAVFMCINTPNDLQALELSDGSYETFQDGGEGILKIFDGKAVLQVEGDACGGRVTGKLTSSMDGDLRFSQSIGKDRCTLVLRSTETGTIKIMPGQSCSNFHGATCSFYGVLKEQTMAQH